MSVKTIEQALLSPQATYIGGGTDIMPLLKNHVRNDENLVFLRGLPALRGIGREEGIVRIGAGESLSDIARDPLIRSQLPAVAQAAAATASPQIRNMATIGGNIMQDRRCIYFNQTQFWRSALPLCYKTGGSVCLQIPNSPVCRAIYYSDVATALLVYDAEALYWENGERRRCGVGELIERHTKANGLPCREHLPLLIEQFEIPLRADDERSGFYKYAMRSSVDFPLINFAVRFGGAQKAKVVAGAVSTEPVILSDTAALLDAGAGDEEVTAACCNELKRLARPIKEALISPAVKRELYAHICFLLSLRR